MNIVLFDNECDTTNECVVLYDNERSTVFDNEWGTTNVCGTMW